MGNRLATLDKLYREGVEGALRAQDDADWSRLYRLGVLRALHRIPRNQLPEDLSVCALTTTALELMSMALFMVNGQRGRMQFAGGGIDDFLAWLNDCRVLFQRSATTESDLLLGKDGKPGGTKFLAMSLEVGQQFLELSDAVQQYRAQHDDEHEDDCERPDDILVVTADMLVGVAGNLLTVATFWLSSDVVSKLNDDIIAYSQELHQWRMIADERPKGTA